MKKKTAHQLSAIFAIIIIALSTWLYLILRAQEAQVAFYDPAKEYNELLQERFEGLEYPLRSINAFYLSSSNVDEEEFSTFTDLALEQYDFISAIFYLSASERVEIIYEEVSSVYPYFASLEQVYRDDIATLAGIHQSNPDQPTTISTFTFKDKSFMGILYELDGDRGYLYMVMDFGLASAQVLDNKVTGNYRIVDQTAKANTVFQSYSNEDEPDFSDSYSGKIHYFETEWDVEIAKPFNITEVVYAGIPIVGVGLAWLAFYLLSSYSSFKRLSEERKSALTQLEFAQDKLIENEKLNAMGGLVAGISHEVNTPLGISITSLSHTRELVSDLEQDFKAGVLDSAKFEDFISAATDLVELSLKNMQRASKLVSSFKRVAVVNADDESEMESTDVGALVKKFTHTFEEVSKPDNLTFDIVEKDTVRVHTFPSVIEQILTYLISNSLLHGFSATQSECLIRITLFSDIDGFYLRFEDNGKGVSNEELKLVFEPFYTTKRGAGNAGLGLSVVHNLLKGKLKTDVHYGSDNNTGFWVQFQIKDLS